MIILKTLSHHSQNRPLQLLAETAPSFDNLSQHLTVFARKVSQYLSQRLRTQRRNPFLRLGLSVIQLRVRVPTMRTKMQRPLLKNEAKIVPQNCCV